MSDQWLLVVFITTSVSTSAGSVHSMLMENLLMKKVNRVKASTSLPHLFNKNPDNFVSQFLTAHESWLHHFDPENKMQSMAWKHAFYSPPGKFCILPSAFKVMASLFWDADGIVLTDCMIVFVCRVDIWSDDCR